MTFNQLRIKALFVRAKGIEPIRLSAPDPKSGLSTNFNTPATVFCHYPFGKDCKITINNPICKNCEILFLHKEYRHQWKSQDCHCCTYRKIDSYVSVIGHEIGDKQQTDSHCR